MAVEEDVGGVEGHVVPGHVPDAFVGAAFTPGIFYQVEWLSVFVYGFAVDEHHVVIGEAPVVPLLLP